MSICGKVIKTTEQTYGTCASADIVGSFKKNNSIYLCHNPNSYNLVSFSYDTNYCLNTNANYYNITTQDITNCTNENDNTIGLIGDNWSLIKFTLPTNTFDYIYVNGNTNPSLKDYIVKSIRCKVTICNDISENYSLSAILYDLKQIHFIVQFKDNLKQNFIFMVKASYDTNTSKLSNNFTVTGFYNLYKYAKSQGMLKCEALGLTLTDITFNNNINKLFLITSISNKSLIWWIPYFDCMNSMFGSSFNIFKLDQTLTKKYVGISFMDDSHIFITTNNLNDTCVSSNYKIEYKILLIE